MKLGFDEHFYVMKVVLMKLYLTTPFGLTSNFPLSNWHVTYLTLYLNFFNCITFVHHFLLNSCSALFCVLSSSDTTWIKNP